MRLLLLLLLPLAGCGNPTPLQPQTGQSLPPALLGEETPPTAAELIEPSEHARPGRTDEILTRSEERTSDRFDLPPD